MPIYWKIRGIEREETDRGHRHRTRHHHVSKDGKCAQCKSQHGRHDRRDAEGSFRHRFTVAVDRDGGAEDGKSDCERDECAGLG